MHQINGYVGPKDELKRLFRPYDRTILCTLDTHDMAFVPYIDVLNRQMRRQWFDIGKDAQKPIAHIETDYFGGGGEQSAAVWKDGKKVFRKKGGGSAIDQALKMIGVIAQGGRGEFDTLGLGHWRSNLDWVKAEIMVRNKEGRRKQWTLMVDAVVAQRKEVTWEEFLEMATSNAYEECHARIMLEKMMEDGRLERTDDKYHATKSRTLDSPWRW